MKRVLIIDKQAGSQSHLETRKILEDELVSRDIKYTILSRQEARKRHATGDFVSSKNHILIISLGGDGTFLHACQLVDSTAIPVFGINSDINLSEGYLLEAEKSNLQNKLEKLFSEPVIPVIKYPRLRVRLNGTLIPVKALNEIYIGRTQGYKMAKYVIETSDGMREQQKSSGILVVTGMGSTAWFKSAGGEPFERDAGFSRFLIRECYEGRLSTCKITAGEFNDSLKVVVTAPDTVVVMDVNQDYKLEKNDVLILEFERDSISIVNINGKD